jgi:hypothetical protein
MISINPVLQNAPLSSCDNFEPLSNRTEESDSHSEKHHSPKIRSDAGIIGNVKFVNEKVIGSMRFKFDRHSKTSEVNSLFSEMLFEAIDLIPDGSQSLSPWK